MLKLYFGFERDALPPDSFLYVYRNHCVVSYEVIIKTSLFINTQYKILKEAKVPLNCKGKWQQKQMKVKLHSMKSLLLFIGKPVNHCHNKFCYSCKLQIKLDET